LTLVRLFSLALGLLLGACSEFPSIPDAGCGNRVIDGTEDCDFFPVTPGSYCRPQGSPGECRLDCSLHATGRALCPPGWGCDTDSICRPPTGEFAEASRATDVGAWSLSAGDFDGDGRGDIMSSEPLDATGATRLRFYYFDDDGALAASHLFPKTLLSPTIAQISQGDSRSDIAFSSGPLSVMYGRPDRAWVPEMFSSYRRANGSVRVVGISDREVQWSSPFTTFISFASGSGFYLGDPETGVLVERVSVPGRIADLAGDLVSGNVFEDPKHSPCLEPVFAMRGATRFSVVDVCDSDDQGAPAWRTKFELQEIALDPPRGIDVAPQVIDMNGDGHLDVLLGAGGRPYVAYGDGNSLHPATPYSDHAGDPAFPSGTPLAVADFTGDGALDFVFPDRLVISIAARAAASPSYHAIGNQLTSPWTVAKIADFNGNGLLDVVAASSGSLNLNFFNGTGTEYFSESVVSTSAPVQFLTAGDFDGDLVGDLALFEVPLPGQTESALKVAFGSPFAPLGSPVAIGQVDHAEALSSYRGAGRDNLTVCSSETTPDGQNGALTLLTGGPDRVPFAPLTLTEFSSNESVVDAGAYAVVSGHFAVPNRTDLLALAFFRRGAGPPPTTDFWFVPDIATPGSAPVRLPGTLAPRLNPLTFSLDNSNFSADIASASADLNGDRRDEAIFAMPADGGQRCALLVLGVDVGGSFASAAREPLIIDEPCKDPQVMAVDPDGIGGADLALLTGRTGADDRHLYVLWNDGSGRFSSQDIAQVSGPGDSPQAFTVLQLDKGPAAFAYVTRDSLRVVRAPVLHEFAAPEALPGDPTLNGGTGVTATDVNGDHVTDLVFSESGKLRVLKAQLKAP